MITLPYPYQNADIRNADVTQTMLDLYNVVQQINAGINIGSTAVVISNPLTVSAASTFSIAPTVNGINSTNTIAVELSGDTTKIQETVRNTSTGTSALTRIDLGNNSSAFAFTLGVYGSNHATKPAYAELMQQAAAPLLIGTNGVANLTIASGGASTFSSSLVATTGFGCNGKTAQTAYASGGALNAYGAGANGFDTAGNASALYAMVVSIRAALVANGTMS